MQHAHLHEREFFINNLLIQRDDCLIKRDDCLIKRDDCLVQHADCLSKCADLHTYTAISSNPSMVLANAGE